jgi:uncharacterized protein YndB with AHSA1/START domain
MQHGYFVLADISGYTSYLAGVELDHAHEILTDLLETIVNRFKTILTISKLEGDAVFAYAPESKIERGETLLELIECTYVAFRDRVDAVHRRTTCTCRACQAIPSLDLKFLAHHGDYIVQNVAGINELVGSDVNLVHRLLKNHISEATGWRAYALFTEASLQHTGLQAERLRVHPQTEAYEHLGEVKTYSLDLHARHKEIIAARRQVITEAEADAVFRQTYAAPLPVVWEWWNDPKRRTQMSGPGTQWTAALRPEGRTGPGARNHCAHGKGVSVETILDWRPFEYVTSQMVDGDNVMTRTVQFELTPDGGGTRTSHRVQVSIPLPRWLRRPLCQFMMSKMYKYDAFLAESARIMAQECSSET